MQPVESALQSNKKKSEFTNEPADPAMENEQLASQEDGESEGESQGSDNSPQNEADTLQKELGQMTETGSVTTHNGRHVIHCLTIIGQIEGHYALPSNNKTTKYEHVIPQLVAIEESSEIEGLLILLNTVGGDIEAGLAIAELISGMKKPTVSLVLGGGHSIGVPLAVAAKKSFIVPTGTMTLHPVRTNGLVLGVPQAFYYFERMQNRITSFVTDNSNIPAERFTELCMNTTELVTDVGSVLDGDQAVQEGLIDQLGSLSDAISALYEMIDENRAANAELQNEKQDTNEQKDGAQKPVKKTAKKAEKNTSSSGNRSSNKSSNRSKKQSEPKE